MPYLWADLLNFFTDDHHPLGDFWYATSILFSFLAFINFFFFIIVAYCLWKKCRLVSVLEGWEASSLAKGTLPPQSRSLEEDREQMALRNL